MIWFLVVFTPLNDGMFAERIIGEYPSYIACQAQLPQAVQDYPTSAFQCRLGART